MIVGAGNLCVPRGLSGVASASVVELARPALMSLGVGQGACRHTWHPEEESSFSEVGQNACRHTWHPEEESSLRQSGAI